MTQLTTTTTSQKSLTRWSAPSLPAALVEPVRQASGLEFSYVPVVSADVAKLIPGALVDLQAAAAPSTEGDVEGLITQMALLFPAGKLSDAETATRLDLYIDLLQDVPFDILRSAFKAVAQTSRFFPTIAEIREAATPALRDRRNKINALKVLEMKHRLDGEPVRTEQPAMTAADITEANAAFEKLGIRTRYRLDGTSYEVERPAQDERGNEISDVEAKAA